MLSISCLKFNEYAFQKYSYLLRKTFCGMIEYIDNRQENILLLAGLFVNKVSIVNIVQIGWRRIIKSYHDIKKMNCFSAINGFFVCQPNGNFSPWDSLIIKIWFLMRIETMIQKPYTNKNFIVWYSTLWTIYVYEYQ